MGKLRHGAHGHHPELGWRRKWGARWGGPRAHTSLLTPHWGLGWDSHSGATPPDPGGDAGHGAEGAARPGAAERRLRAPGSHRLDPSPRPSPQSRFAPPQLELVRPRPHPIRLPGEPPPSPPRPRSHAQPPPAPPAESIPVGKAPGVAAPPIKPLTTGTGTSPRPCRASVSPLGEGGPPPPPRGGTYLPVGTRLLEHPAKKPRGRRVRGHRDGTGAAG